MSNFVTDNTTLSFPKVDLNPVGTGDPTKFLSAAEWNAICQAAYDLRGATPKYTAGDPNGALSGAKGDIARDTTNGKIWINTTGGTVWKAVPMTATAPTPGTYGPGVSLTVDAQGLVTAASTASIPGRFLARQVLTGSGTYTKTPGTNSVEVWKIGGGGGGGGAGATGIAVTSGGNTGVLSRFRIAITNGGAYACGSAGSGGANTGGNGGTGGDTTLVLDGVTYTSKGGLGGLGAVGSAGALLLPAAALSTGSVGPAGATFAQWLGQQGWSDATRFVSGAGGTSPMGTGGDRSTSTAANGNAASNYGAGGAGAVAQGTGRVGGAGSPGVIYIDEYS